LDPGIAEVAMSVKEKNRHSIFLRWFCSNDA